MKALRLIPVVVLPVMLVAGMFFALQVSAAPAAAIVVDTLADDDNEDSYCSLREAIIAANTNSAKGACPAGESGAADTITFSVGGTITLTSLLPNIVAGNALVIDGGEVITVSGDNSVRVLSVLSEAQLTLENITVADGYSSTGGGIFNLGTLNITNSTFSAHRAGGNGGGIINGGTLTIANSTFSGNSAGGNGGGIYNSSTLNIANSIFTGNSATNHGRAINEYGTLTITDSSFDTNSATNVGGGIYNYGTLTIANSTFSSNGADSGGGIRNGGALDITNSTFSGNSAGLAGGGAIANGGTLNITGNYFSGNSADMDGGGIYNKGILDITDSTFSGNSATGGGGGIWTNYALTVTDSTFSANSADMAGGGIWTYSALTVTDSTFSANSADEYGGGIYNEGMLDIANSTFSSNSAVDYGGGISNWLGTVTITSCTYSGNSAPADNGGAINNSGTLAITSSILADSPGGNCRGTISDGGYNIDDGTTCGFGTASWSNTDPLLAPLEDNGGPTWTHALLDGSPAIDAVPTGSCTLATDQRGIPRPQGAACDTGAFEYEAIAGLTASNDSPTTLGSTTNFSAPVTAGTNVSYAWDFGDETFGSGAVVTHTYETPGIYTATVTASNSISEGDADTIATVEEAIAGLFAYNDSPTTLGSTTNFSATVTAGTNVSYAWDFGDETFGSEAVVSHTYETPGIYTATVTASNSISTEMATSQVNVIGDDYHIYLPLITR